MQFRNHAHQGETDAEAGSGARSCFICLYEDIKNVRQHIARNTDPRISDTNDRVAVARAYRCRDASRGALQERQEFTRGALKAGAALLRSYSSNYLGDLTMEGIY
jgi:hypothetical protein